MYSPISTAKQDDTIREYAKNRNLEIVKTYADEGKSGLNVAGRQSLQRLIDDVQSGNAEFEAVLVYASAGGDDSRMRTKVPITSISASARASSFTNVPQPTAFTALHHGFDGECPCCRRKFDQA